MTYAEKTLHSKNPVVRYAHHSRFVRSLELLKFTDQTRVIDFGCGDGSFLNMLLVGQGGYLLGFEPHSNDIQPPVAGNKVSILTSWNDVQRHCEREGKATLVTSFEVLEHFSADGQIRALADIRDILSDDGKLLLSVPVEGGPVAVLKNLFRWSTSWGRQQSKTYNLTNVIRSLMWLPIPEERNKTGYLNHMGFYFSDLELLINRHFVIEKRIFSPFPMLGASLNSQVFYLARKL